MNNISILIHIYPHLHKTLSEIGLSLLLRLAFYLQASIVPTALAPQVAGITGMQKWASLNPLPTGNIFICIFLDGEQ